MQFEDLRVWQAARELTKAVYDTSNSGSFARDFALRDQIRRASVSVMSNIAEGAESRTNRLFVDFLGRAKASAGEVRAQLYVALDCAYIADEDFLSLRDGAMSVSKQLYRLMQTLEPRGDAPIVREDLVEYLAPQSGDQPY